MKKALLLDFDGTVYRAGQLNNDLIARMATDYESVILASNNSSISHQCITNMLARYPMVTVITPQLIAARLIASHDGEISIVSNFLTCYSIARAEYSNNPLLVSIVDAHARDFILSAGISKPLRIVAKTAHIVPSDSMHYYTIALNSDKILASEGLSCGAMLGDVCKADTNIGKNSKIYMAILRDYLFEAGLVPVAVVGDNRDTDGRLAKDLGCRYWHHPWVA